MKALPFTFNLTLSYAAFIILLQVVFALRVTQPTEEGEVYGSNTGDGRNKVYMTTGK